MLLKAEKAATDGGPFHDDVSGTGLRRLHLCLVKTPLLISETRVGWLEVSLIGAKLSLERRAKLSLERRRNSAR
jgi:hypothetical protein